MLEKNSKDYNIQSIYSVSEISNRIKSILENKFGVIKVKGEISGLKIATSGHAYFSLKDSNALITAICWKNNLNKIQFPLKEGLEVIATGKITAYIGHSKYQISVNLIELDGIGSFLKILQERRAKLEKEGLFQDQHKKSIPFMPHKIGVITSPTGAVIQDIIHRISDRCPSHLILWSASMQGENSAQEVSNAVEGFNNLPIDQKPDVLIIARGGGSIEDLWSFNEEIVVRAVFHSEIPIISAIGHETDYTLTDLVSDRRAPTPTAAAEFAVPVIKDVKLNIDSLYARLQNKLTDLLNYQSSILTGYTRALDKVPNHLNYITQRMDDISFRLSEGLISKLNKKKMLLQQFSISRISPNRILKYKYLQYQNSWSRIFANRFKIIDLYNHNLQVSASLLASLNYKNVLKRGYAVIKSQDGNFISTKKSVISAKKFSIEMHDGEVLIENK